MMDKDTAVKILKTSDCVCTGVGHFKIISPVKVELIADFIEQQAEQINAMRSCSNCKKLANGVCGGGYVECNNNNYKWWEWGVSHE